MKSLKNSKLYKTIIEKVNGDKVLSWQFDVENLEHYFTDKTWNKKEKEFNFHVCLRGKGEICWEEFNNMINYVNERYQKISNRTNSITKIDFKNMFSEFSNCPLSGLILLENGDYITIREEYFSYDDAYVLDVRRHIIPHIELDKDLEFIDCSNKLILRQN